MKKAQTVFLWIILFAVNAHDGNAQNHVTPGIGPTQTKQQPSLRETLQWLKEAFADHGSYRWEGNDHSTNILDKQPVSFDGCTISWIETKVTALTGGRTSGITSRYLDTVPLAEISPTSIRAQTSPYASLGDPGSILGLTTLAGKKSIKSKDLSDGEIRFFEGTMIWFDNQDIAERIAKAITYASNVCRRSQPF